MQSRFLGTNYFELEYVGCPQNETAVPKRFGTAKGVVLSAASPKAINHTGYHFGRKSEDRHRGK